MVDLSLLTSRRSRSSSSSLSPLHPAETFLSVTVCEKGLRVLKKKVQFTQPTSYSVILSSAINDVVFEKRAVHPSYDTIFSSTLMIQFLKKVIYSALVCRACIPDVRNRVLWLYSSHANCSAIMCHDFIPLVCCDFYSDRVTNSASVCSDFILALWTAWHSCTMTSSRARL